MPEAPLKTQCVLVADDLTGACDGAAPFAAAGLRTVVPLTAGAGAADVVAFSTASRDVDPAEARQRLCEIAAKVGRLAPRILFKKIDSTLRGNTGHEIVAAVEVFGCEAAVVNPAFPAMGRTVQAGHLLSGDASFHPIQLVTFLEAHGARRCRHVPPGAIEMVIQSGVRFLSMEAVRQSDLDDMAKELLTIRRRVLWAGSSGLARALAARLGRRAKPRPAASARGGVLFCIGSDHAVTADQERRLLRVRDVAMQPAALAEGRHALLRIPPGQIGEEEVRATLAGCRPAAVVLSGGDTAALVCAALGVEAIDLAGEFAPGIAIGTLRGGAFDGVAVVTKSGGFGNPDALIQIADYFHG